MDETRPPSYRDLPSHGLFAAAIPDTLFHYTTLEAAHGILTSRQIWLTKIQHLNDAAELRYAVELFRALAQDWPADLPSDARRFLLETAEQLGLSLNVNICLASFCTDGDLLSQWRAYGAAANGVAMGFSGAFLRHLSQEGLFHIWRCLYRRDQHEAIIAELILLLLRLYEAGRNGNRGEEGWHEWLRGSFSAVFLQVAPVLKHPSFHEEKEWRIISAPVPPQDRNFHVLVSAARLRPTYQLRFPAAEDGTCRVLTRVYIGPSADAALIQDALTLLARLHGHAEIAVRPSRIPYRAV